MGHEYHRMLIEELTQIPDEKRYLQLIASCRSTIPELKPRIFLTTNPGGVGHQWVKQRFIDPAPANTLFKDPVSGRTRIYIPATLDDNPRLKEVDPDYIKQLDALKNTDESLWKAWRKGDWDTFAGQYFRTYSKDVHVIPHHSPTKEGWVMGSLDWGRVDNFAFYLHHVRPAVFRGVKFHRIITFAEIYGTEKKPEEWAETIEQRLKGYNLKISSLSNIMADNQIFTQSATDFGTTIADLFYQENEEYRGILQPASKNRVAGWENMQHWLSMAPDGLPYWQITENCINLIRTLPAAVHDENKVEDIDQSGEDDALDSCLIAGTMIKTMCGEKPIESIQAGERVLTRKGYKIVMNSGLTSLAEKVFEVELSNGRRLIGTANHPVFIQEKGFVPIDSLRYDNRVCTQLSYPQAFKSLMEKGIIFLKNTISKEKVKCFILQYGNTISEKLAKAITYTIKTIIERIMIFQILFGLLPLSTYPIMVNSILHQKNILIESDHLQKLGTLQKKAESGIGKIVKMHGRKRKNIQNNVSFVAENMKHIFQKYLNFVIIIVRQRILGLDDEARVLKVKFHSTQPVYNLEVQGQPEYFANGILVHNCRYGFSSIKWINADVGTAESGIINKETTTIEEDKDIFGEDEEEFFKKII